MKNDENFPVTLKLGIKTLPHAEGLASPQYQTDLAAGLDLSAALSRDEEITLSPGKRAIIPTGLSIELPPSFEAQIRPRSGLAAKHGLTVLNAPGTIDADYRGEIKVILINLGEEPVKISRGMRIAQMVIQQIARADLVVQEQLGSTNRGAQGFGSTGTHHKEQ